MIFRQIQYGTALGLNAAACRQAAVLGAVIYYEVEEI